MGMLISNQSGNLNFSKPSYDQFCLRTCFPGITKFYMKMGSAILADMFS